MNSDLRLIAGVLGFIVVGGVVGGVLLYGFISLINFFFPDKKGVSVREENLALLKTGGLLGNERGIFLGRCTEDGENFEILYYNSDRHIVTIAPTGSGKGVSAQIPALLNPNYPCSALVIDVKGQLAAVTGQTRFLCGQSLFAINPFNVLDIPTATYNPLKHLDPQSLSFSADCRKIAEGLVDQREGSHWQMSALDVVALLIEWVVIEEEEKNLLTVQRLLNLPDNERIAFFTKMQGCPRPAMAQAAARYALEDTEVRNCIQTAVVQLGFLRDEGIARVLRGGGENEISFADLKKQLMTVYLILPPDLLITHGRFLRLLVMSALTELFKERAVPENPVLFMLDEFAQLGPMPLIENAAAICRDYKIRLWLILQNIPQLKSLYKDRWESFLSSSGVTQFFAPNDMDTATYISKRGGTQIITRKSQSFNTSSNSSGSSTSYSEAVEPNITPEQAIGIHNNAQLLFTPNVGSVLYARRDRYFEDPMLKNMIGVKDPYHMTTEELQEFRDAMQAGISLFSKWPADYFREAAAETEGLDFAKNIFPSQFYKLSCGLIVYEVLEECDDPPPNVYTFYTKDQGPPF